MKRILALWLAAMLIVVQPCYAVVCVGFGQDTATEPASGTVLIGSDVIADASEVLVGTNTVVYSSGIVATWSESSTTTTISEVCMYVKGWLGGNAKMVLANTDGTIVAVSNQVAVPEFNTKSWICATYSSLPTITKNTSYALGIAVDTDNGLYVEYGSGTSSISYDNTGQSYTSITTLDLTSTISSVAQLPWYGKK